MRVTLLGILGFIAVVVLLGYVVSELERVAQKKERPQPNPDVLPGDL